MLIYLYKNDDFDQHNNQFHMCICNIYISSTHFPIPMCKRQIPSNRNSQDILHANSWVYMFIQVVVMRLVISGRSVAKRVHTFIRVGMSR